MGHLPLPRRVLFILVVVNQYLTSGASMNLFKSVVVCVAVVSIGGCDSSSPTVVELPESEDSTARESTFIPVGSSPNHASDKAPQGTQTEAIIGQPVYKILSSAEWQQVLAAQELAGFGIDLTDGFIHLSSGDQVKKIAQLYFDGRNDLMLISIDGGSLREALRWEKSLDDALFPHVYGTVPMGAVIDAVPLRLGTDGKHQFPF
jgi:uncharacterized protein (DUF952 family)